MTWQYIAGFFDGEGSIVTKRDGYALMISQTNEEVLNNIKNYTGVGNVYPITKRKEHWKDAWVYCVTDYHGTAKVLKGMLPHLVVKKKLAQKAIVQVNILLRERNKILQKHRFRQNEAIKLRKKGLTFRAIGKILSIDFGYARRLILDIRKQNGIWCP